MFFSKKTFVCYAEFMHENNRIGAGDSFRDAATCKRLSKAPESHCHFAKIQDRKRRSFVHLPEKHKKAFFCEKTFEKRLDFYLLKVYNHCINSKSCEYLFTEVVMNKENIKKVVLAYSGGLDTSIIIPWLKENYNNCEVIAVSGNVGQADELEGLEEKALKTGASKLYVLDLTDEYVDEYIMPCLKAGAIYEEYLLGTSHARPCIAKGK